MDAGRDSLSTATTFVGTVMTSGGFTLYRNTKDRPTPPTSSCLGTCASTWSPIGGAAQPTLDGVDAKLIGTLVRPDGSKQLTVDGWPVYRYVKDMLPGTVNGQGVDGVWLAVGPDGKPLTEKAAPAAAPAPPRQAPAKAAPAKAPAAAAPKVVAPTKAPGRRPEGDAQAAGRRRRRPSSATRRARRAPTESGRRPGRERPRRSARVPARGDQDGSGLRAREGCTRIGSPGIFGYSGG